MKIRMLLITLLCLPITAMATLPIKCIPIPSLEKELNINDFKKCTTLLKQCPKHGPVVDETCAQRTASDNPVCNQLKALSDRLNASTTAITAKPVSHFHIITQTFIADGQEQFFILAPKGCLIDTAIDPRQLDDGLAKQYHLNSFLIMNWGQPRFRLNHDGTKTFTVLLKVTDSCRACPVIGWATVNFNFTKDNMFESTKLESFKKR